MRYLKIIVMFLLAGQCLGQTVYYMSECGASHTGCFTDTDCPATPATCCNPEVTGGTQANPWCIDPGNDGTREGPEFLMDGTGVELAAGDTIKMCAGACNGSGEETWPLDGDGSLAIMQPKVTGTAVNPITFTLDTGETVIWSSDENQDDTFQAGEGSGFMCMDNDASCDNTDNLFYYHFLGDPDATGSPHLFFEKTNQIMFGLNSDAKGWIFDSVVFRYSSDCIWSGEPGGGMFPYYDNCVRFAQEHHGIKIKELQGKFIVRHSEFYGIADYAFRMQCGKDGAGGPGGSADIHDNLFYNMVYVNNDYSCEDHTWFDNVIFDINRGFVVEDRNENMVFEDNVMYCEGTWMNDAPGPVEESCEAGVNVNDGDNPGEEGKSLNIRIRRNIIRGNSDLHNGTDDGSQYQCIVVTASRIDATPLDAIVENNICANIWPKNSGDGLKRNSIAIGTDEKVIVRNNTIVEFSKGIWLDDAGGTVVHEVYNNLLIRPDTSGSPELDIQAGADTSIVDNNNFYGDNQNPVVNWNGTARTCADINDEATANNNVCLSTVFVNITPGDEANWDLHITAGDNNINQGRVAGAPTDDIDKETRTGNPDIGADEFIAASAEPSKLEGGASISGSAQIVRILQRKDLTGLEKAYMIKEFKHARREIENGI